MTTPTIFFEDIVLDVTDIVATVTADRDEMVAYGKQFDPWPMHVDDEAGRATPYGGLIASGGCTIGLWYRAGHLDQTEGELAFLGGVEWTVRFVEPVRPGRCSAAALHPVRSG